MKAADTFPHIWSPTAFPKAWKDTFYEDVDCFWDSYKSDALHVFQDRLGCKHEQMFMTFFQ